MAIQEEMLLYELLFSFKQWLTIYNSAEAAEHFEVWGTKGILGFSNTGDTAVIPDLILQSTILMKQFGEISRLNILSN